jgi:hypothetical protein
MANGNEPVKKYRIGFITASIWKNKSGDSTFYNVTLQSRYKDESGEWQDATSLSHSDLLNAAAVLTKAERWIAEQ